MRLDLGVALLEKNVKNRKIKKFICPHMGVSAEPRYIGSHSAL